MAPKPKFQEGEKLLCYHGPLLYEAKCMKLDVRDGKVHYLIHYNGWNKNWDEWVQESRIMKNNEAGYQKQRELLKNHGALTKKTKTAKKLEKELLKQQKIQGEKAAKEKEAKDARKDKSSTAKEKLSTAKEKQSSKEKDKKETKQSGSTSQSAADRKRERELEKEQKEKEKAQNEKEKKEDKDKASAVPSSQSSSSTQESTSSSQGALGEPKRKRAKTDQSVESEETYLSKIEVKIKIPEDLKPVLVDDWDLITRQKMLVTVPCKMTVDEIIDEYIKTKCAKNANVNKDAVVETMLGCKDYFNVMLGPQLLYKFERPQYSEILSEHPDKPMSSIYGAIHFLRLFVRLGAMLAYTALDERTVHILLNHIHDFLKYMSKNGPVFFKISNYEIATPDYHRKAI
ncbi:mortality factor 4-like protein 1 [Plakobranchus ocellatus]|uniref:Mortality factor 4-like protein 1 n=1 Tax=Plakobranchus ocellatus TaxID=259542 RepID=A0AAV4CH97_9GAST|nr:mortality factor 4-like protein 1 [Plakobranchus ocellatus]